jgi:hypothetical protein
VREEPHFILFAATWAKFDQLNFIKLSLQRLLSLLNRHDTKKQGKQLPA